MNNTTLYIKNMVCYRCIMVVEDLLAKLGFTPLHVELEKGYHTGNHRKSRTGTYPANITVCGI